MTATAYANPAASYAAGLVVAYCRISSDRAGAGLGVEAQAGAIRALAESRGIRIDRVITDNDVSAYNRRKVRPGYAELLDLMAEGRVSTIFVWHTDRLHRQNRELEPFIDLVELHGITVQTVQSGVLDLASPSGQMNARIAGAIAQGESGHKAERLRLMHNRKAKAGEFHGGRRRFGYNRDMTELDAAEAAVIVDAADRVLAGESLGSITRDWNNRGIKTPTGKAWRSPNVGTLLRSPHLAAIRRHNGETTAAKWPPVFDAAKHEALVRYLGAPSRRVSGFTGVVVYALSGVIRCDVCGGPLYGRPTKLKSGPAYACRTGFCTQAPTAKVDALVAELVIDRLSTVDASGVFVAPVDAAKANARAAERMDLEAARRALPAQLGRLSPEDYAAGLEAIDTRLSELDAEATAEDDAARLPARVLDGLTGHPVDVTARKWDGLTDDRRRAVVAALGAPTLARAARKGVGLPFDPDRVKPNWHPTA